MQECVVHALHDSPRNQIIVDVDLMDRPLSAGTPFWIYIAFWRNTHSLRSADHTMHISITTLNTYDRMDKFELFPESGRSSDFMRILNVAPIPLNRNSQDKSPI